MTREDVIQLALDAGFERNTLGWSFTYGRLDYHLERFAAAVEQRTLERAAQVAEEPHEFTSTEASRIAAAIRALGEKE